MKNVGILYDNISGNVGDQAIGISVREMLAEMAVDYEELVPGRFNPSDYRTIIIGGGYLLQPSPNFFYDKFRVPGKHILNCCGIVGSPDDLQYLNDYLYVTVRSNGDKQKLSYLSREITVVPCTTTLLKDLPHFDLKIQKPSIGVHLWEGLVDEESLVEYLSNQPFHIYFLPITHYNRDSTYLGRLSRKVKNSTLLPILRPEEIFTVIGDFDYFMCTSLHGAVFAYVHNVPFLLYDSQDKQRFFMEDRKLDSYLFRGFEELSARFGELQNSKPDYSAVLAHDFEVLREHRMRIKDLLIERTAGVDAEPTVSGRKSQTEDQQATIQERNFQIHYLQKQVEALAAQATELHSSLEFKDAHIGDLETNLQEKVAEISSLEASLQEKVAEISSLEASLQEKEFQIYQIQHSIPMQLVDRYQRVIEKLLRPGTRRRYYYGVGLTGIRVILNEGWRSFWFKFRRWLRQRTGTLQHDPYQLWIAQNEPREEELDHYKRESLSFQYRPKISIITPVRNTDEKWLRPAIESVLNQAYDNWELCLASDASAKPYICEILRAYEQKDSRIKVKFLGENLGISRASNDALSLASGEFIGLLDHDDELAPSALYEVVKLLNEKPEVDFIYSDEDKITHEGKRVSPFCKPDWSPDMLLSCMYTDHFSVYRKAIVDDIGGFRVEYDDAVDYDLVLRFIEKTPNIYHIPKILYHNRVREGSPKSTIEASSQAHNAGKKALEDYLVRNGIEGEVLSGEWEGCYRVKRTILGSPLVSIVIPTKDKLNFLRPCVESILRKTDYGNYEILIVDNQSREQRTRRYYDEIKKNPKIRILEYDKPFNFSAINNYAASEAKGDYILFLNNDTKVISEEWLSAMLEHAQRKEVGAVGCLLLYADNKIQHAGIIAGAGLPGRHSHRYSPVSRPGYYLRPHLVHNLTAVTGACTLLRKEVFEEIGGFDEKLPIAFNDVDMCLKVREKGYLIVYTPYARLYHPECSSRGHDDTIEKQARAFKEEAYLKSKWGRALDSVDPYYNRNLTRTGEDFSLRIWHEEALRLREPLSTPDANNVASYISWLSEGMDDNTTSPLTRLWNEVYRQRPDLQQAFPDIFGADREGFRDWVLTHGKTEYSVDGVRMQLASASNQTTERVLTRSPAEIDSAAELGINVAGYITGEFGVAAAARALIRAIEEAGIPYVLNNIESQVHSSQDPTFQNFSETNQYPFNLIHVNAAESLQFSFKKGPTYFTGKHNIGYWAWELSRFPEEWFDRFKYYDEIWVLSDFSLDSISRASPIPVIKIPPSIYLDDTNIHSDRKRFGLSDDTYVFLFNFDFHSRFQRKNPLAVVEAFKMAFRNSKEAVLVLKYINHTYYKSEAKVLKKAIAGAPNIKIIDTHLRKDDLYSLVATCDCFVSLHRSEGFGLTIAEAMYFKKPVIGTAYSGNMDFMNVNNSFPIKYKLVDVGEQAYPPFKKGYVWAEPDVNHASEMMRFVHENREYAEKMGEQAHQDIKALYSPAIVGQAIRNRLTMIIGKTGCYRAV